MSQSFSGLAITQHAMRGDVYRCYNSELRYVTKIFSLNFVFRLFETVLIQTVDAMAHVVLVLAEPAGNHFQCLVTLVTFLKRNTNQQ